MITSIYWIHHKDHTDMFSQGYIGVSKNVEERFKRHSKHSENQHLKNAIRVYGWDNLVKKIILIAENDYCYEMELKLRPTKQIGWNIAEGGAKPPVSQYRGPDYKSPLKGKSKPTPWMVGRKVSDREKQLASERRKVKVKYQDTVYDSLECLADTLGIKYSTLTNRIYRNPTKYGYEVIRI